MDQGYGTRVFDLDFDEDRLSESAEIEKEYRALRRVIDSGNGEDRKSRIRRLRGRMPIKYSRYQTFKLIRKFEPFMRLPRELRLKIWEYTLKPRYIQVLLSSTLKATANE
jgi:hypothetical protein